MRKKIRTSSRFFNACEGENDHSPPVLLRRALQHLHIGVKAAKGEQDAGLGELRRELDASSEGIFGRRKTIVVGQAAQR